MKISCDISKNFFEIFDEAKGVALHKKTILKNYETKCLSYTQQMILIFCSLFSLSLLSSLIGGFYGFIFFGITLLISLLYLSTNLIALITSYLFHKKQKFQNTIILDKHGLTDQSYFDIKLVIPWDKIEAIIIKKNSVTILTDTPCFFYFDVAKRKKIEEAILKYHPETPILRGSKE